MPRAFSKIEHSFSQCEHSSQVENFKKSWFLIVLFEALCFNLKSIPFYFKFFLHSINLFFSITCLWVAQNEIIHGLVVFFTLAPKMDKFTYLHVKPLFFVQMWMKQPLSHLIISASIDLTHPLKHLLENVN
jgi:hypothetical protein